MSIDLLCFDDLDAFGGEITDPLAALDQDLYHRLVEPPGSNPDDPDRGLGIENALSGGGVDKGLAARIEGEFRKDDRVASVRATVTDIGDGGNSGAVFRIEIEVATNDAVLAMDLALSSSGLSRYS